MTPPSPTDAERLAGLRGRLGESRDGWTRGLSIANLRWLLDLAARGVEAEKELREIDVVLGNRSAFDAFATRAEKIEHAINVLRSLNAPATIAATGSDAR